MSFSPLTQQNSKHRAPIQIIGCEGCGTRIWMFGIVAIYLVSLARRTLILHFRMVTISFYTHITITRRAIVV